MGIDITIHVAQTFACRGGGESGGHDGWPESIIAQFKFREYNYAHR